MDVFKPRCLVLCTVSVNQTQQNENFSVIFSVTPAVYPFLLLCIVFHSLYRMSVIAVMQAYLYDIRSGSYLHKLTGHSDTVSAVAFHPQFPQVYMPCRYSCSFHPYLSVFVLTESYCFMVYHPVLWVVDHTSYHNLPLRFHLLLAPNYAAR